MNVFLRGLITIQFILNAANKRICNDLNLSYFICCLLRILYKTRHDLNLLNVRFSGYVSIDGM